MIPEGVVWWESPEGATNCVGFDGYMCLVMKDGRGPWVIVRCV